MMESTVEIVKFNEDKLYCPVINGEPYVVVNKMIENIGLNYDTAIDSINKSRFKKWTATLKIKELKDEFQHAIWQVTFMKNEQKTEIFQFQLAVWGVIFSELGGYEYTVLPTRKLAGWLSSIQINKVSPNVRNILEKYQDECDEVLYQWFFGSMAQRKNALMEKISIERQILILENKLESNENYKTLKNLKASEMRLGKTMKEFDRQIITSQKKLWD